MPSTIISAFLSIALLGLLRYPLAVQGPQSNADDVYIPSPPKPTWWNNVGITFAGDKFIYALNTNGFSLDSTDPNGDNYQEFARQFKIVGGTRDTVFEHPIASALGLGGFPCRDIYVGEGRSSTSVAMKKLLTSLQPISTG